MRLAVGILILGLCTVGSVRASETVLERCGQYVTGNAVLAADLDCSASNQEQAVALLTGNLDLRGFTLTGAVRDGSRAVFCEQNCQVRGPGTIVGSIHTNIWYHGIVASDLIVLGHDADRDTAFFGARVTLVYVTVSGFDTAVLGDRRARVLDSTLIGDGSWASGIKAGRATVVRSTITGFGIAGVWGGRTRIIDSSVRGNTIHPVCAGGCADWPCADLVSYQRPTLRRASTCETSLDPVTCSSWGVCEGD